jgi:cobyrinic acid a,c-diamide synthase
MIIQQCQYYLEVPVILVIDTEGITRGIAPLLQGYINFEKKCK